MEMPDLTHHLSQETTSRLSNPMKDIWKLIQSRSRPDTISLANGDPHHSLYPFSKVSFTVPDLSFMDGETDLISSWRTQSSTVPTRTISSAKNDADDTSLQGALQYTSAAGLPDTVSAIRSFAQFLHAPPPSVKHGVVLSLGNCDGVTKAFRLLGNVGDTFLTEQFAFPALTTAASAHGIKWLGIEMDENGLVPTKMEAVLKGWDETKRGRRPHVVYLVPCGQNPTGSTMSLERRQEIYRIAQEWDMIIIEDDPYYFMQYAALETAEKMTFIPSFLSMDVDGRVIRLDSFSKVLAPGTRLGFISASPMFCEHLLKYTDFSTQHPHAFGQILITKLLDPKQGWGINGFMCWIRSLCEDYRSRRDYLVDVFETQMGQCRYADIDVPQSGMFVWIRVHLEKHPRFIRSNMAKLMDELFEKFLDEGLVVMPAKMFAIMGDNETSISHRMNYFRATFCGNKESINRGMVRFVDVVKSFFAPPESYKEDLIADISSADYRLQMVQVMGHVIGSKRKFSDVNELPRMPVIMSAKCR